MTDKLRTLKYYTLFAFFVIGVVTVLLGQVLPILATRLQLNDVELGTLLLAQFAGSAFGTLIIGRLARRQGFVVTTLVGLTAMIAGLPGLNFSEFYLCWLAIFVYGAGLGMTIPAINLLTIEMTPAPMQSSSVNLINFAWGVGAICSQPFVSRVSDGKSLVSVTVILVAALAILAVCFFAAARDLPHQRVNITEFDRSPIWRRPSAWLFLLFGFFVIGIESGLGGWLTTYSESIKDAGHSVNATVVFFSFLVFGRGLAAFVSRRVSENVLLSICVVTLLIGIFLIVFDESLALVGAAAAGLGTSAIFPTNMVRFTKAFGSTATQRAMPLFISGICGAASLSWLTGLVSTRYGNLRLGLGVLLVSSVFVVILHSAIALTFRTSRDTEV